MRPYTNALASLTAVFPGAVYSPRPRLDYSASHSPVTETGTVPTVTHTYTALLNHAILATATLTVTDTTTSTVLTPVPAAIAPAATEVAVNHDLGTLRFHSSLSGHALSVVYTPLGSLPTADYDNQLQLELAAVQTALNGATSSFSGTTANEVTLNADKSDADATLAFGRAGQTYPARLRWDKTANQFYLLAGGGNETGQATLNLDGLVVATSATVGGQAVVVANNADLAKAHTQNTDSGTTGTTFDIASGTVGAPRLTVQNGILKIFTNEGLGAYHPLISGAFSAYPSADSRVEVSEYLKQPQLYFHGEGGAQAEDAMIRWASGYGSTGRFEFINEALTAPAAVSVGALTAASLALTTRLPGTQIATDWAAEAHTGTTSGYGRRIAGPQHTSADTVAELVGFSVVAPSKTAGTITSAISLDVEAPTAGGTDNWAARFKGRTVIARTLAANAPFLYCKPGDTADYYQQLIRLENGGAAYYNIGYNVGSAIWWHYASGYNLQFTCSHAINLRSGTDCATTVVATGSGTTGVFAAFQATGQSASNSVVHTDLCGIWIKPTTKSGSATPTRACGLYVEAATAGTTNYNIYGPTMKIGSAATVVLTGAGTDNVTVGATTLGFYGAAAVSRPVVADPAPFGNADNEIGGVTFAAAESIEQAPKTADVEILRDKCEELADDCRALRGTVLALADALQGLGLVSAT